MLNFPRRFACLAFMLATPLAAPVIAQDKTALCDTTGEIVSAAVTSRVGGALSDETIKAISQTFDGDKANFRAAVQPIVDWVYTLDEAQLSDEVATSYVAACLAQ